MSDRVKKKSSETAKSKPNRIPFTLLYILNVDGVVRLVGFHSDPPPIPKSQIEDVWRLLAPSNLIEHYPYIDKDESVEIIYIPFAGVQGKLLQNDVKERLLVGVELIR